MDSVKIKHWLLDKGIKQVDIARSLRISAPLVWMTIHGRSRNTKVITWLLNKGCPPELVCKSDAPN